MTAARASRVGMNGRGSGINDRGGSRAGTAWLPLGIAAPVGAGRALV